MTLTDIKTKFTSNVIHSTSRIEIIRCGHIFRIYIASSNVIHSTTRIEILNIKSLSSALYTSNVIHSTTRIEIRNGIITISGIWVFYCNPLNNKELNKTEEQGVTPYDLYTIKM